jgi:hypothetical protein
MFRDPFNPFTIISKKNRNKATERGRLIPVIFFRDVDGNWTIPIKPWDFSPAVKLSQSRSVRYSITAKPAAADYDHRARLLPKM